MPDRSGWADTDDDTGVEPDRGSRPRISRWQKVVGIVFLVVVLMFVILRLAGVGGGFGRHSPGGDSPRQDTPAERQEPETDTGKCGEHAAPPWVPDHDGDGCPG